MGKNFIDFLSSLIHGEKLDYHYEDEKDEDKKIVDSVDLINKFVALKDPKTNQVKNYYEIDFIECVGKWKWI